MTSSVSGSVFLFYYTFSLVVRERKKSLPLLLSEPFPPFQTSIHTCSKDVLYRWTNGSAPLKAKTKKGREQE